MAPGTIVYVEGNIGAGKTTYLHYIAEKDSPYIHIFPEPVKEWGPLLSLYYQDPFRYAFPFQLAVLNSKRRLWNQIRRLPPYSIAYLERSPRSDLHVFCAIAKDLGYLTEKEYDILHECYRRFLGDIAGTCAKHNITEQSLYINEKPEECLRRIRKRDQADCKVELFYLTLIEEYSQKAAGATPRVNTMGVVAPNRC